MEIVSGHYTIKQIFKDHWDEFVKKHGSSIPDYAVWNVERMFLCREPDGLGYHRYVCPKHPGEVTTVPHSCKSRFCNSCGVGRTNDWIERAQSEFPDAPYYHITFTISDKLRNYFLLLPQLRKVLFVSAAKVVIGWFQERGVLPAIISVLHTSGRDLRFHPHIHMVVSSGGMCLKTKKRWIVQEFIPYEMLRKRWQTTLLVSLKQFLPEDLKEELFSMEWYVNVGIRLENARLTVGYVGRYTKKPVLAETRIVGYDGADVTFIYHDFTTETEVRWKLPVEKFISLLIQHIPPKNFRMIRYYGLMAHRAKKQWKGLVFHLLNQTMRVVKTLTWRMQRILYDALDPLICRICGAEKILVELAFRRASGEMVVKPIHV